MSGEALLKTLKSLGYEGGSLQHLEWLFDYEVLYDYLLYLLIMLINILGH